jgi:cytochrome c peroxidase
MHSGRFATLRETVAFYTGGRGHAIPPGVEMQPHWHIWDPKLSDEELDRLVDFLQALSDETFRPQVPAALPSGLEPVGISPLAKTSGLAETTRAPRPRGES